MKSIRCRLHCATWCEYFKSGECISQEKCEYQTEHMSVTFPETIFMPTKEAWEKLQAEIAMRREKLAEAEQRAKVIELALALAAENHRCEGCPSKECDGSIRGTQKCRDTIALLYIVQAEREIKEEGKDG